MVLTTILRNINAILYSYSKACHGLKFTLSMFYILQETKDITLLLVFTFQWLFCVTEFRIPQKSPIIGVSRICLNNIQFALLETR